MTALPQHAARAAQETREQGFEEAWAAYLYDLSIYAATNPLYEIQGDCTSDR